MVAKKGLFAFATKDINELDILKNEMGSMGLMWMAYGWRYSTRIRRLPCIWQTQFNGQHHTDFAEHRALLCKP